MIPLATSRPARMPVSVAPQLSSPRNRRIALAVAERLPVEIVLAVLVRIDHGHELQVGAGYHSGVDLALRLRAAAHLREQDHVARRDVATAAEHAPGDDGQRGGGGESAEKFAAIDVVHCSILAQRKDRIGGIMDQRWIHGEWSDTTMNHETAFEMAVSNIRFGVGVTREVGMDLADIGARRVLVVDRSVVARLAPFRRVAESLDATDIRYDVYDRVRVEPTDGSLRDAIAFAGESPLRRNRRGGRRIDHRHRQSGEPLHVPVRLPTSSTTSTRRSARASRYPAPEAPDGHPDDGRYRQRDDGRRDLRSGTAACQDGNRQSASEADARAISIRTTRGRCRRRSLPPQGWTFCAMPSSPTRPCRSTSDPDRIGRR